MILFHGNAGKEIQKYLGYISPKKKGKSQHGVGLYCTNDYSCARKYGRTVWQLDVKLREQDQSNNVYISTDDFLNAMYFLPKAAFKDLKKYVEVYHSDRINLESAMILIMNHYPMFHKVQDEINTFMILNGAKFTRTRSFNDFIIIHDYSIIASVNRSSTYETQEITYE